ncbi:MAG TPA: universal stress protein [Actinomycetes bacterium]
MSEKRAVLVAVDGSEDSARAVEWAVPEARRQQLPLVLVHAVPHLLREDVAPPVADQRARMDRVLREARQRAAQTPAVETEIRRLEPLGLDVGPAIVDSAAPGDTLVVGARGHGKMAGVVLGSVSQYAVRHATGTVVVVRPRADESATRTVVGFDQTPGAQRALDWAMSRSADQGEVTAMRAWHGTALYGTANPLPLPEDAVRQQEKEQAMLDAELAPWREKHPDVRLIGEAVPGHAGHLLAVASEHAALVVVGSRGRGPLATTLLGSVGQAVLHHARCPVAVVR